MINSTDQYDIAVLAPKELSMHFKNCFHAASARLVSYISEVAPIRKGHLKSERDVNIYRPTYWGSECDNIDFERLYQ